MQKSSGREPEVKTEVKIEVKSEVKVVSGKKEKKAPQEGKKKVEPQEGKKKKKKAPQEGKKAEPQEGEQKKERKVQQDSTKWRFRAVSVAPAPVVEYIAPAPAVFYVAQMQQQQQHRGQMKGGSFASKHHPPSAMKHDAVLVLEVLSLLKHLRARRQPAVQCSRPVNEQQHDHSSVDFVAKGRVLPVTQVIDMSKEMKVKTEATKSQKQMAFASRSQLCKDMIRTHSPRVTSQTKSVGARS